MGKSEGPIRMNPKDGTVLTLSEEEFYQYMENGYFRGTRYRWPSRGGVYRVFISWSSYDKFTQNMESTGLKNIFFEKQFQPTNKKTLFGAFAHKVFRSHFTIL